MTDWLQRQAVSIGVALDQTMLDRLNAYCRLLQEWNKMINLTAVTRTEDIYEVHFLDSLSVCLVADPRSGQSLIDIGTGAGFPGLVLAIAFPGLRVVLLESLAKKAAFLDEAVRVLGLSGQVTVVRARAEDAAQEAAYREAFDWVVSRGVASLDVLGEYCLPFVRLGGFFVAQKGPKAAEEIERAASAVELLGGETAQTVDWALPNGAERVLIRIRKQSKTPPEYPRRAGIPAKRPLS